MVFRVIGGVVVCGFALYGLVRYLERPRAMEVVEHWPDPKHGAEAEPKPVEGSTESVVGQATHEGPAAEAS